MQAWPALLAMLVAQPRVHTVADVAQIQVHVANCCRDNKDRLTHFADS